LLAKIKDMLNEIKIVKF